MENLIMNSIMLDINETANYFNDLFNGNTNQDCNLGYSVIVEDGKSIYDIPDLDLDLDLNINGSNVIIDRCKDQKHAILLETICDVNYNVNQINNWSNDFKYVSENSYVSGKISDKLNCREKHASYYYDICSKKLAS